MATINDITTVIRAALLEIGVEGQIDVDLGVALSSEQFGADDGAPCRIRITVAPAGAA